jgi:hypothetical protein
MFNYLVEICAFGRDNVAYHNHSLLARHSVFAGKASDVRRLI